ncbi:MAG: DUF885 domain-containing protein [Gammaproteobacteria bacterium]|nr:DUF885 domain-containing protein [Gammaproteobacteria bacterium]
MRLRTTVCAYGWLVAMAVGILMMAGCGSDSDSIGQQPAASDESPWRSFTDEFVESHFAAAPTRAVWAGRHDYDGQLQAVTLAAIRENTAMLSGYARRTAEEFPADALTPAEELERQHLLSAIEGMLFGVEVAEYHLRNPAWYAGPLSPSVYVAREYAPRDVRLAALTSHLEKIPAYLQQMRETLRPPFPRPFVRTALVRFAGLASHLEGDLPGLFAAVADEDLQAEFAAALDSAVAALRETENWLELRLDDAAGDFALGEERYQELLRRAYRIDLPWQTLKNVAQRDLARNLELLRSACKLIDSAITIADCAARVRSDKPPQGAVARASEQLPQLREFLIAKDLIGIPGEETAYVAEAPAYRRTNSAYIEIPGPYEEGLPAIYYIAGPDPEWPLEMRRQYLPGEAALLNISVHEVWPGHFLHSLYLKRSANRMGKLFWNAMLSEGWAHYAEELMQEAGLSEGKPLLRAGQILDALMRDVRFLSSIGLHVEGMSVDTSQRMFAELAYLDPGNAAQQALRGAYDPDYFVYTLGKLIIMRMREDWTANRGGRAAWKEFHETLLSLGNAPLPALREAMLGPNAPGPLL